MRLILAILIALSLSLTGSPGAATPAPSESCTMVGAEGGMAPDHETMDCCSQECATPAPSAVLPLSSIHGESVQPVDIDQRRPSVARLNSVQLALDDPPPRPFFA